MAYDNWTIGGVTVPHIRTVANDQSSRTTTLSCSALRENIESGEPRDEIALFEEMSCDVITNTQLMNGGSCLQVCNGDPVIVSDGVDAWVAALERPVINENKLSEKRIDYDLVIHYETVPRGITYSTNGTYDPEEPADEEDEPDDSMIATKRYYRGFCGISNIEYYQYTDSTNGSSPSCAIIGKMIITESRKVKSVKISCATVGLGKTTWIEVNGSRINLTNASWEDFTFDLSPTSYTISIQTRDNTADKTGDFMDSYGVSILYIEVVYE